MTEAQAKEKGYEIKVENFLFPLRVKHKQEEIQTDLSKLYLMQNMGNGLVVT